MSKLFIMSNEEKNRILNLHENAKQKELSVKNTNNLLSEDMEPVAGMENVPLGKVEAVQQALVDLGYNLGKTGRNKDGVDGVFGSKSRNAVIKYQQDKGISPALGNVGPKTAASLGVEQLTSTSSKKTSTGSASSDSASSGASSGSATDSPFKNKEEGDAFRKWMHTNFPNDVKNLDLDLVGSHTNKTIKNAFNSKPKGWTNTTYGQYYLKNKGKDQSNQPKPSQDSLSTNIDTNFQNKFKLAALSSTDSTYVCKAGQTECGQFVNDFSKKLSYVGNAWLAHDLDKVGTRVKSVYTSLSPQQVEKIFNIFKQIERQGGPKERESGGQVENIKMLQQELIKPISASDLKVDDVVGIYYPASSHHEEAFHEAGKPYFVSDGKGGWKKGSNIQKGKGFGMNTHVGIVGGVKNGVPLIFHNISGNVYSDPYNKLRGGGKISWIKRS